MRVMLAGGGTAGHIEPALALADALRRVDPASKLTCLGTERGLETRLVPLRGYELELIPRCRCPRSVTPKLLDRARAAGRRGQRPSAGDRPDQGRSVVVGFGGYVAHPGLPRGQAPPGADRGARGEPRPAWPTGWAPGSPRTSFTGHPAPPLRHGEYIGIPIRREIADLDRLGLGDKARAHFGLRPDLPVLLVTGGSQGARSLNEAVSARPGGSAGRRPGAAHHRPAQRPRGPGRVRPACPTWPLPYMDRMDLAYAAADFALCRAGAMTCAELTAVGPAGRLRPAARSATASSG